MKSLSLAVAALAVTGALAVVRGPWRSEAAPPAADAAFTTSPRPEAPPDVVPAAGGDALGERRMARLASDCAAQLYEKARRQPDNARLLEQAAAHYRACLSHEPTVADAGALFADARRDLEQIDKALARLKARPTAKPAPVTAPAPAERLPVEADRDEEPAPPPAREPAPAAKAPARSGELQMFGPDGTLFRRQRQD